MIKAILLLAIVAFVSAQLTGKCVTLVDDNTLCDSTAAFPNKVCVYFSDATSVNISSACNEASMQTWMDACPKKNVEVQAFCNGEGFLFGNTQNQGLCGRFATTACTDDASCDIPAPPVSPPTAPIEYCYECCTECFNTTQCDEKVASASGFPIYTNSTECTTCPAPPVASPVAAPTAATPTGGNPNTPTKTPTKSNSGAIVVASGIVLAVASALLL